MNRLEMPPQNKFKDLGFFILCFSLRYVPG
jgi:hypothetical protein